MTFTEAAVEVLRLTGKPLHYKKITEIAIEKNLLSHVGKTPETTMSARLATMVKKDRGDAPILKVKPGVFALRDFSEEALQDAEEPAENTAPADATQGEAEQAADPVAESAETQIERRALPGADVFPEEDDDDDLILANLDDDKDKEEDQRRNGRRRGRRRAGRDGADNKTESAGTSSTRSRGPARQTQTRQRRTSKAKTTTVRGDWNKAPNDGDDLGLDLADAIETVLGGRGRHGKTYQEIAQELIDKGRLSGSAANLEPTLAAAVRGDNARRTSTRGRARFREVGSEIRLAKWDMPGDAGRATKDVERAADRQRNAVRASLVKTLRSMPATGLLELVATWLNAQGVRSIRAVISNVGEFDLAGTLHRGPEVIPLAIGIFASKTIEREHVLAIRGAAQHYGQAKAAWLLTLGNVREDVRQEAQSEGAMPVAIFDGNALAESMESVGVGIVQTYVPLATLDIALLESLGDTNASNNADKSSDADDDNPRPARRRRGRRRPRGRDKAAADGTETDSKEKTDAEVPTEALPIVEAEESTDVAVKSAQIPEIKESSEAIAES